MSDAEFHPVLQNAVETNMHFVMRASFVGFQNDVFLWKGFRLLTKLSPEEGHPCESGRISY